MNAYKSLMSSYPLVTKVWNVREVWLTHNKLKSFEMWESPLESWRTHKYSGRLSRIKCLI
jgi:hypothetical protein